MSEQTVVLHVRPTPVADGARSLSLTADPALAVQTATSRADALDSLSTTAVDYVVCDHAPDAGLDGLEILKAISASHPELPVLLCTGTPDGRVAAEATRLGVTEYVPRSETPPEDRIRALESDASQGPSTDARSDDHSTRLGDSSEAIAGSISAAVITIDSDSHIAYVNDQAMALTGYDREELVGESFTKLMPDSLQGPHLTAVRDYLEDRERSVDWEYLEFPLVNADGETITTAVSFEDFELSEEWYCTGVIRNISERKERERRLERTNRRLDVALNGTDTGVYEVNLATGEVIWDAATADLFETTPEAFGGSTEDFFAYVHPEDRERLETRLAEARERDEQYEVEFRATVGGETRWIYTNGVIEDREGHPPRLVAIATDITDQKHRELELQTNNESLRALNRLAAQENLSREGVLDRVLELGADRLGLSIGYLSRIDGEDYEVLQVVGDHPVIEPGTSTHLDNTFCKQIVEGGETLQIQDAQREGWGDEAAYQTSGFACYYGGAIHVDGDLYGTLCFADTEPRTSPFTDAQQTFLELLVEWVSRELERRQREDELEHYEDIIEAVDDGVYALDDDGRFTFVNEAMASLTGHDEAALLGSHTSRIKTPDVVEEAESLVREMVFEDREDVETFDLSLQRADGESFPAEDHMTALWDDDGRLEGTAGVIRDVTERRERELELRDAYRRIEQILDRIGAAFFAVDEDWTLTYWNARAEEVLGRSADDVMGEDLWEMFPEAVDATFYDAYHEAMRTQEPVTFEEYYPPVERWFRVNAYPSTDGLSVYFHDITDQRERDAKLSGLLDTSRSLMQGRSKTDVAETVVAAAESELGFDLNLVRLHDRESGALEPVAGSEQMPDRPMYDDDEAFPGTAFQRGETVRVDDFDDVTNYDSQDATAAMYVPIGDHGILSVATYEADPFDDADVSVAEILASNAAAALDRVEREQDLMRYETVMENVRDMVYVLDEEGRFQLVTEPLADWLGFERGAMLGEHPREVLDDRSVAAFERRIRDLRTERENESIQMETHLVTVDGEELPAEIEVSLIDDHVFRGTVGVVRDLTELKRTREELRDERDRFSYLFNNLPDAVVETEQAVDAPTVRSVNPAFTEVFGYDHEQALGDHLSALITPPEEAEHPEADHLLDMDATGDTVQAEVRRRTADGFRDFLFRGVPYERDDGRQWGFGIYTDITDQKERERRLEVLNRVLRHNLRNDLTVVLGLADELGEQLEDEMLLSLVDRLQQKATDVAAVSDRAREVERSIRREDAGTKPVDAPSAVESLAETYDETTAATVETSVPETAARTADGRFTRVLNELFENSLEHSGDDPTIRVDVSVGDDHVRVTVSDDGPGIPDHELDVLTGDEPITQLSHGSGLGLWLVIWVTEAYGGTVSFDDSAAGGAAVTLELPRTDV
ncbi:PAS domain S-box protein [Haloarcula marina]|uniref:PAS domain S-box protein n=1 Tax=Haloarcula marina TaxID=2961574 RepID=UPI0020B75607|nr:PAS domain S-box protein [Halomicroarcula marina]